MSRTTAIFFSSSVSRWRRPRHEDGLLGVLVSLDGVDPHFLGRQAQCPEERLGGNLPLSSANLVCNADCPSTVYSSFTVSYVSILIVFVSRGTRLRSSKASCSHAFISLSILYFGPSCALICL